MTIRVLRWRSLMGLAMVTLAFAGDAVAQSSVDPLTLYPKVAGLPGYRSTPAGEIHESCLHVVPNGSHINGDTATVTDDAGLVTAQYNPVCAYPILNGFPKGEQALTESSAAGPGGGFPDASANSWLADINALVPSVDELVANFTIPPYPEMPDAGLTIFMWPGVVFEPNQGGNGNIIQPLVVFQPNGYGTCTLSFCYMINPFALVNQQGYVTSPAPANPGDSITMTSYIDRVVDAGTTDASYEWFYEVYDHTTSTEVYGYAFEPVNGAGSAQIEAINLEVATSPDPPLTDCRQLPTAAGISNWDLKVYQGTPNWNSYVNVTADAGWALGWGGRPIWTPNCNFSEFVARDGGGAGSLLATINYNYCIPSGTALIECTGSSSDDPYCCSTPGGGAIGCNSGVCCNDVAGSCSQASDCCTGNICDNGSCAIDANQGYCSSNSSCASDICSTGACACYANGTDLGASYPWWECCSTNATLTGGNYYCSAQPSLLSSCPPASCPFQQECDPSDHKCHLTGPGSAYETCTGMTGACQLSPIALGCSSTGQCCNSTDAGCYTDSDCCSTNACTGDGGSLGVCKVTNNWAQSCSATSQCFWAPIGAACTSGKCN